MPVRLSTADADFTERFAAFLEADRAADADVGRVVADIVAAVRKDGDRTLAAYTERFDRHVVAADRLRIDADEIAAAKARCRPELLETLAFARDRIEAYHRAQRPDDARFTDAAGAELGWRWTALEAAGLYVPGGTASYPSSVLMNAVPARVAGVARLVMAVPCPGGAVNPLVLAAADLCGVDEIYRVGGAQAIAALAYGTETIRPVDKIVGPGNAYVAEAKRQVFGVVGIDMIAGPSEVLIVADGSNDPAWIAADLLAQAEHDAAAQSILVTDDAAFADLVETEVQRQIARLPRAETAAASWRDHGATIRLRSLDECPPIVDRIAPEHLELAVDDPEPLLRKIRNAGAVFLGRHTPEVIGDYVGGPNHVLPTARSARFSSGLSVLDFMKRTSILSLTPEALRSLAPAAIALAEAEGLDAHGRSVAIRLNL